MIHVIFLGAYFALISIISSFLAQIRPDTAISLKPTLHRRILFEQGKIWDNTTPYLTRACKLGLYTKHNTGIEIAGKFLPTSSRYEAWEGYPLGPNYDPETNQQTLISERQQSSTCRNVPGEIGGKLAENGIEQIFMSGYCYCLFYKDESCRDNSVPSLLMRNKVSNALGDDWSGNIKSFTCKKYSHWLSFVGCKLWFSDGGGPDPPEKSEYVQQTGWDIDEWTGKGPCRSISPIVMKHWTISGCTCNFYTDSECEKRILLDGHAGWVRRENMTIFGDQGVMSYRCDLPYAPPFAVPNSFFEKGY
ncbi:hypothetical protein TWF481_007517 [Arthrobotrys musiformis]|uniref:Uncharacterized protein n=1 Tax=Arthrobotrys musiformis TaxID=47236 RepID=A0AAV9WDN2_9PEZI